VLERLARHDHHTASGRLATPARTTQFQRLAGHDARRRVADVHAVGVHHPRHHLLVGVDVGRGDVLLGADEVDDLRDVAARQRFDLAAREPRRIADDAALAAAERDVGQRALPGHPGGQRRHLVQRHAGVVADATLGGTERDVVLDAEAGEHLDLAAVHEHRARHGDLPLRVAEDVPDAALEAEHGRRAVEVLEGSAENPTFDAGNGHGCTPIVTRSGYHW